MRSSGTRTDPSYPFSGLNGDRSVWEPLKPKVSNRDSGPPGENGMRIGLGKAQGNVLSLRSSREDSRVTVMIAFLCQAVKSAADENLSHKERLWDDLRLMIRSLSLTSRIGFSCH